MLIGGSYLLAEDGSSLASPKPKTPEYLCQHWVHSFEEQQQADKDSIYRPKDFKNFREADLECNISSTKMVIANGIIYLPTMLTISSLESGDLIRAKVSFR